MRRRTATSGRHRQTIFNVSRRRLCNRGPLFSFLLTASNALIKGAGLTVSLCARFFRLQTGPENAAFCSMPSTRTGSAARTACGRSKPRVREGGRRPIRGHCQRHGRPHLALEVLSIGRGADVLTATMTFAATANAITYVGANPVFVDVSSATWTVDPQMLDEELTRRGRRGKQAAAVITVDLYGQCADYANLEEVCRKQGVPLIEDAAEALGATYQQKKAGAFGQCAAFSFNGNKIITTSGGGMLVSNRRDVVERARHLATQARDTAPHYQHSDIGYNYRLSNLLAAVGRGQLQSLPDKLAKRRAVNETYRRALQRVPGIDFMPEAPYGTSNCWLTCLTVAPEVFGASRDDIRLAAEAQNTIAPT